MNAEIRCDKCRFWERCDEDSEKGVCHRVPPKPEPDNENGYAQYGSFPTLWEGSWCGEFKPRVPMATAADPFPFVTES